jgi:hypothetical protein
MHACMHVETRMHAQRTLFVVLLLEFTKYTKPITKKQKKESIMQ